MIKSLTLSVCSETFKKPNPITRGYVVIEVCSKQPYGSYINASIASSKVAKLELSTLASNFTDPTSRV